MKINGTDAGNKLNRIDRHRKYALERRPSLRRGRRATRWLRLLQKASAEAPPRPEVGIWNQCAKDGADMEPKAPEAENKLNQHINRGSSSYKETRPSSGKRAPANPRGRVGPTANPQRTEEEGARRPSRPEPRPAEPPAPRAREPPSSGRKPKGGIERK